MSDLLGVKSCLPIYLLSFPAGERTDYASLFLYISRSTTDRQQQRAGGCRNRGRKKATKSDFNVVEKKDDGGLSPGIKRIMGLQLRLST